MGNSTSTVKRRHGHMHSGHKHTKRCHHNRKSRGGARTMTNRTYETPVPFPEYDEVPTRRPGTLYEAPEPLYVAPEEVYANASTPYANASLSSQRMSRMQEPALPSRRQPSRKCKTKKCYKEGRSQPKTTKKKKVVRFIKKIFRRKPKSLQHQRLLSLGSRAEDAIA